MALEIEAKVKVDSHDAVRGRLQAIGAKRLGLVQETNVIFDTKDGALLAAGHGLRVRSAVALDDGEDKATLTFKGPRLPGVMKSRQEIEIGVSDAEQARRILRALGFIEAFVFQKRRESWQTGGCEVELDELPELGCFVEIEGPNEDAIRAAQEAIGLARLPLMREGYISLLMRHRNARYPAS